MEAGSIMPARVLSRPSNPDQDVEMDECHRSSTADRHREDFAPPHAVNIITSWNESKSTVWRITATFWCMLVMGANDAAYGAILPYVCLAITSFFFHVYWLTISSSLRYITTEATQSFHWYSWRLSRAIVSLHFSITSYTSILAGEVLPSLVLDAICLHSQ